MYRIDFIVIKHTQAAIELTFSSHPTTIVFNQFYQPIKSLLSEKKCVFEH